MNPGTPFSSRIDEIDRTVRRARRAFRSGTWPAVDPSERTRALDVWADLLQAHLPEIALLVTQEVSKPIRDSTTVDVPGLIRAIRWYARLPDRLAGEHPDVGPDALALVSREPAGVVACITPWNFPLAAIGYEAAPALMLGNSVIVKPSQLTTRCVKRCIELAHEAGIPADTLSLVIGGIDAGAALGRHHDVDVISITGGEQAGRAFLGYSAESNGKRVWPELGGKTCALVCADATGTDRIADTLAWGISFNAGQMCTGIARVLVERSRCAEIAEALNCRLSRLLLGDPFDPDTDVGPLVTADAARAIRMHAEQLGLGDSCASGRYVTPAVATFDSIDSLPPYVEVFAPLAVVVPYDSVSEALASVDDTGYGMGLSVWTANLDAAIDISRQAKVGTVWVNSYEADGLSVPAGGTRRSGYGRSKGLAVLDKYSDLKTTWIELAGAQ
jgi:gamma-glutamyl-gamma-aminobutyraldehyde dehydrogenase